MAAVRRPTHTRLMPATAADRSCSRSASGAATARVVTTRVVTTRAAARSLTDGRLGHCCFEILHVTLQRKIQRVRGDEGARHRHRRIRHRNV